MLLHLEFPWVSIASDASPREQLRYYREHRGLLRRELGDMTGMSETTILNYELGYMPIAYDIPVPVTGQRIVQLIGI